MLGFIFWKKLAKASRRRVVDENTGCSNSNNTISLCFDFIEIKERNHLLGFVFWKKLAKGSRRRVVDENTGCSNFENSFHELG